MSSSKNKVIKNTLVKRIFWFVIGVFIFFALFAAAIQIPFIQTTIVNELSQSVSRKIQHQVTIEHVDLNWFDEMRLSGIRIMDREQNLMIGIGDLLVDFDITGLISANQIMLDGATLTSADIRLTKYTKDREINMGTFIKSIKNWVNPKDQPAKRDFRINQVFLVDSKVTLNNTTKDSIFNGFDYHHFVLDSLNSEIQELKIRNDTIRLIIQRMEAMEPITALTVHDFTTDFYFNSNVLAFRDMHLAVGESEIQDSLVFNFDKPSALSSFTDSVQVVANFNQVNIASTDLKLFVPTLRNTDQRYVLSGLFNGKVKSFNFNNVELSFGDRSTLSGNVSLEGLPVFQDTFIDASLSNSVLSPNDLRPFIGDQLYNQVLKFGTITLNSQFLGFPRDFVANGTFYTGLGTLVSDINLKIDNETQNANYSGSLATNNFDLGGWTGQPEVFQDMALKGQIRGSGLSIDKADFELKAQVEKFGFKNYTYTNILTDARLAKELFIGTLEIDDPNLKFTSNASIDLREDVDHIALEATLDTALLKPLNFLNEDASLSTYVDLDFTGLTLDEIVGFANFRDTRFSYRGQQLDIKNLEVISQKKVNERRVNIDSDRLSFNAQGDFEFSTLFEDAQRLIYEYRLNLINDKQGLARYYANKAPQAHNKYRIDFSAVFKDANPFLSLVIPNLKLSNNTPVEGYFRHGFTSMLAASSTVDTLRFKNNIVYNAQVDLNTSKISDSTSVLAMAYISSEEQDIGTLATTEDLVFEAIWSDDHIDFESTIKVKDNPGNNANLSGQLSFLTDRTLLTFNNSDFRALNQKWQLAPDNQVSISNREFDFKSITLFNKAQSITINGIISPDSSKRLLVEFNQFDVGNLNPLLQYKLQGELDANIEFSNLFGEPLINSGLTIRDFQIGKFPVGDVIGNSRWNNLSRYFDVSLTAIREGQNVVDIKGVYTPKVKEQLNLLAHFNGASLNLVEPFVDRTFSNLQGYLTGEIKVGGPVNKPQLNGNLTVSEAKFHVNYLNTDYSYQGDVYFTENSFGVDNQILYDENGNQALIKGGLLHNGFKQLQLDLSGQLSNFMVLDTDQDQNDLYYGTAIVSGDIEFKGPMGNFSVKAAATSEKGTRIYIPINDYSDVEAKDYINFVSFQDTVNIGNPDADVKQVNLSGINLDFDLDITPDAYMEIIFDLKAGDIIRGRGNGQLNLLIDTQGDFNMFGEYTIQQGGYNFTLYNIINKEFNILPTSKISWYGDPYEGILDIQATYEQTADVSPLFQDQENEAAVSQRYPAIVELDLQGKLLSPEIGFDIYLKDDQMVDPELSRKIQEIKNDEQALKRQVFSLIVLRQFSPPDDLRLGTGNPLGGSVSELLSNQLSYWFSQVDENLEIDVDLNGLDQEALNTFQLRLSYTFLDGRLRVTREGGFTNTVESKSDFSSIAGDWTLEYLLSPDGKFRAKMYNRNTYNSLNSGIEDAYTTQAGFSLIHTQSFNTLNDLFSRENKKKKNPQDVSLNTDSSDEPDPE